MSLNGLMDGEVHLWHAPPALIRARIPEPESLLSLPEAERARQFVFDKDRELFLLGRALLRTALSSYVPVAVQEWQFVADAMGKPEVDQPESRRGLRFNLSHTDGLIACVVSWRGAVGVDVESMRREVDWQAIAQRFTPEEYQQICGTLPNKRREAFFTIWTLKEAYAKACGRGLSSGFAGSRFLLADDGTLNEARVDESDSQWSFFCPPLSAEHRAAAGVEHERGTKVKLVLRGM